MDIRLVRIDDRLLHGQVATVWTKHPQIQRILIVSDSVSKDELRKTLVIQASPPGIQVNVIPVEKMCTVFFNLRFKNSKVMVLFTNPQDVQYSVERGITFDSINIGGMSFTTGKRMITTTVAVNAEDIASFKYLYEQGIQLEIRKVVADSQIDLIERLKKECLI